MEKRILIQDLRDHIGKEVTIAGWIDVRRDQGKMVFLDIRDRSGSVQGVVLPGSNALETAHEIRAEFVVTMSGAVNKRPEKNINADVQNGDIELEIKEIKILSEAEVPFELDSEVNLDTLLDNQPYMLRNERSRSIFKLQETIIEAFREGLKKEGFTEFQAPALVGGDAEGGAAAFEVKYHHEQTAYLATSPQFYKQIMVGVFERAFTTLKVFRGEKHATPRHLNEYTTMDFEMGFIEDHRDVMDVHERIIRHVVQHAIDRHPHIFDQFNTEKPLLSQKIPVLKLKDAQEILEKGYGQKCVGEPDLEPEHERQICEWAKKEHQSDFIFITHYPTSKRPFYTYEDEADPGFTKSFDLLFRGLEITTGGQRIHNPDLLKKKIEERGLDPEKFAFYLQAFEVGMPPHGGCATGLERVTARMLELPNVKEATLFPRDLNRIDRLLSTDAHE